MQVYSEAKKGGVCHRQFAKQKMRYPEFCTDMRGAQIVCFVISSRNVAEFDL